MEMETRARTSRLRRNSAWIAGGVLLLALCACYLPDNFKSEIRLGRTGDYAISFWGDLIWAPLYRDIQKNNIPAAEIPGKIAEIQKDLQRDPHFKKVESAGSGRFKVEYEREGHLADSDMVTFVRRNAIIIQIVAKPDGTVVVNGRTMKPSEAQEATTLGLDVQGEFRIIADGMVKEQNASSVKPFGRYQVYIWNIQNSFSPPPHFVMQREGAWPSKKS
jgi:hypothetical protein